MKIIVIFLLCGLVVDLAFADNESTSTARPRPKIGETYNLEINNDLMMMFIS